MFDGADGPAEVFRSVGTSQWATNFTSGHCAPSGTVAHQGNSLSDPVIGAMHDSQVVAGGTTDCDCGFVGPISSSQISHQTLVKNNSLYTFTATGIPYSGENECQSGAASYELNGGNIVCGEVIAINGATPVGYQGGSFTLQNAIVWLGTAIQGDSGAPAGDGPSLSAQGRPGSSRWIITRFQ